MLVCYIKCTTKCNLSSNYIQAAPDPKLAADKFETSCEADSDKKAGLTKTLANIASANNSATTGAAARDSSSDNDDDDGNDAENNDDDEDDDNEDDDEEENDEEDDEEQDTGSETNDG